MIWMATALALPLESFTTFIEGQPAARERELSRIERKWEDSYTPMLLELARFSSTRQASKLLRLAERGTGESFGNLEKGWAHVWSEEPQFHPEYGAFKAKLYSRLDARFAAYFDAPTDNALIRLDEIRWGGVKRDGIPPLHQPKTLSVSEATYLDGDDIVFGVSLNGEHRAYPKRILAWHEMVRDTVGGTSINGVYCTLCGSMIVYDTVHEGTHYELGTSGFLYRSNKLMVDYETESLWSTLNGEPVVGPLVGKGIALTSLWVVTTTWKDWKTRHPDTTVLSLETGHARDYGEGVAYKAYFSNDELMFSVPAYPKTLKNKASVLVLRFAQSPVSIEVEGLPALVQSRVGDQEFVVLTDGGSRVYDATGVQFRRDGERLIDAKGRQWRVEEEALVTEGERRARLSSHNAFWFGWIAANPEGKLLRFGE